MISGISTLDFDHMEVLGYTLGEIASEKAGIIKVGCSLFLIVNHLNFLERSANRQC